MVFQLTSTICLLEEVKCVCGCGREAVIQLCSERPVVRMSDDGQGMELEGTFAWDRNLYAPEQNDEIDQHVTSNTRELASKLKDCILHYLTTNN